MNGTEVIKTAGIGNEKCQQAKILNHPFQVELQKEMYKKAEKQDNDKREANELGVLRLLEGNKTCEDKILKEIEQTDREHIADAPMEAFKNQKLTS